MAQSQPLTCNRCGRFIGPETRWRRTEKGVFCQPCLNALWRAKGYAAERQLVKKLRNLGYNSLRMAVSGAGEESVPDVIAFKQPNGPALAFEVKAVTASRWTVYAFKEKDGERKEGQILKCLRYVDEMYPKTMEKRAGVAIKFLLGERRKSPWVVKWVPFPQNRDFTMVQDISVDVSDKSDFPQLTDPTRSKRARRLVRKRRNRNATRV